MTKKNIEKTIGTHLTNTMLCYEIQFSGKVIQVAINSNITYEAFIEMLKESGKPILLKIYDVSSSLSGSSKTVFESESTGGTDTVEILNFLIVIA